MNRNVRGAAVLVMLASILVALVPYFGAADGEPGRVRYALLFAAPFFVSGLIALMSDMLDRPRYVMTAGLALIPISLISIVAVPLLLPALMLAVLGARATRPGWSIEMPGSIAIIVCVVGSMLSLLLHDDPRTWTTADGHQYFASDVVTGTEALIAGAFLATAVAVAWLVADRSATGEEGVGETLHAGVDREQ